MKQAYKEKGITLVALVITIVIIIILSVITINTIFGENGLVKSAEKGQLEYEIASTRERLELVLADAYKEKVTTTEFTEEEFLNNELEDYVYDREPDSEIFNEDGTDYISLNGHIFVLDRSVPELGEYDGTEENRPPKIRSINIVSKTDTSVNIEVIAARAEKIKYRYSIKELEQGDESYTQETEKSENTNEFTGLQAPKKYTVKVELIQDGNMVDTETIGVLIGKLEKGVVRFEDPRWENGIASVKILTDETGYTLQYQIDGAEDDSWIDTTSGSIISGLKYDQSVYGRLWNGIDESEPASVYIDDDVEPKVTVEVEGENTTSSVKVKAKAVDNESGMTSTITYKYYVKETSASDSSYIEKGSNTTGNYTIDKLKQGTSYDIKVEATGDKAGNTGIGYLKNQETGTLPGGETGQEQGAITFSNATWSGGQAKVTISTNTQLQLQYQKGSTTGNWTNISNGGEVVGLNHNDTVYARLTDGTNYGDEASTTIIDTIKPTINEIQEGTITETSIQVKVIANDNESGVGTYKYYLNGTLKDTLTTNSYTYTGLSEATDYDIKVEVLDKANNMIEKTKKISTDGEKFSEIYETTKEYTDSEGNTAWIPGGFAVGITNKINKVSKGLVITDKIDENNKSIGNEFVWIPVGTYHTPNGDKTNKLARRTFTSSGSTAVTASNGDGAIETKVSAHYEYSYGEGDSRSVAYKTIGTFKSKATTKGGFYIGRYEQGTGNVIKKNVVPWRKISMNQAKKQAELIDKGSSYVVSELISSYAWDTTLNFICQTNSEGYILATTRDRKYGNLGRGGAALENTGMYEADNYSNIHDILGNVSEWTTEYSSEYGSVIRGGQYEDSGVQFPAYRNSAAGNVTYLSTNRFPYTTLCKIN